MARRSRTQTLALWANGTCVGRWTVNARGDMELQYDPAWRSSSVGWPLSLSLPFGLGDEPLKGPAVEAFDLLSAIGRDCVGVLQFLPEGAAPEANSTFKRPCEPHSLLPSARQPRADAPHGQPSAPDPPATAARQRSMAPAMASAIGEARRSVRTVRHPSCSVEERMPGPGRQAVHQKGDRPEDPERDPPYRQLKALRAIHQGQESDHMRPGDKHCPEERPHAASFDIHPAHPPHDQRRQQERDPPALYRQQRGSLLNERDQAWLPTLVPPV